MMVLLKLVKTYCLPRLLYGCESWPIETVDRPKHELDVIWNNGFRHIFNCCWRENVKPLQFFCQSLPLSYLIVDVYSKLQRTDNIVLRTLMRVPVVKYKMLVLAAKYGLSDVRGFVCYYGFCVVMFFVQKVQL